MNYLKKLIRQELEMRGLLLTHDTVDAVADYIETRNLESAELYSVEEWIKETKQNYPDSFANIENVIRKAIKYMSKQKRECYDQTGMLPSIDDYRMAFDSDEFLQEIGCALQLEDLLQYVTEYYVLSHDDLREEIKNL